MYLSEHLEDEAGQRHEMCGVVPYRTRMQARLTLGYREATALCPSPLASAAQTLRGHPDVKQCGDVERATAAAFADALRTGQEETVLFSPACASFDQFADFE